jgi:hypothetical protein
MLERKKGTLTDSNAPSDCIVLAGGWLLPLPCPARLAGPARPTALQPLAPGAADPRLLPEAKHSAPTCWRGASSNKGNERGRVMVARSSSSSSSSPSPSNRPSPRPRQLPANKSDGEAALQQLQLDVLRRSAELPRLIAELRVRRCSSTAINSSGGGGGGGRGGGGGGGGGGEGPPPEPPSTPVVANDGGVDGDGRSLPTAGDGADELMPPDTVARVMHEADAWLQSTGGAAETATAAAAAADTGALSARVEELEQQVRVLEGEVAQALDEAEQQAAGRETALVEVAALRRCTEADGNAGSGAATAAEEKEEDALRRAGEEAAALREQVNSGSY